MESGSTGGGSFCRGTDPPRCNKTFLLSCMLHICLIEVQQLLNVSLQKRIKQVCAIQIELLKLKSLCSIHVD